MVNILKKQIIQITIDGPAASGKSTIGKMVAKKLNIEFFSSGKIFRSYAYGLQDTNYKNEKEIKKNIKNLIFVYKNDNFFINHKNITNYVSNDKYSLISSIISSYSCVRKKYQMDLAKIIRNKSIVVEGRDIGSKILPKAQFKFYLDASIETRVKRRVKQINFNTNINKYKQIYNEIKLRDEQDKKRRLSPLIKPIDCICINSDNKTIKQIVNTITHIVLKKLKNNNYD